jgi:hypothetical protein
MIDSVKLRNLRNAEFIQFVTDALAIIATNNAQTLQIQSQYNALLALKTSLDTLFNKEQASPITDELIALDAKRDSLLNGIISLVQGNTNHFDESIRKQALALQANINSYGSGIARENYQSETAIISNLLADWVKPELAAAVTALQLATWKTQLETANNAFNARYLARTRDKGSAPVDSLNDKRQLATNAYYDLRDMLDAQFIVQKGAAPFSKAVNELNALIERYNRLVTARGKGPDENTSGTP